MARIGSGSEVAYGPEEVAKAADYGAIETLLVLDERLRLERDGEGDWDIDVDQLIETTDRKAATLPSSPRSLRPDATLESGRCRGATALPPRLRPLPTIRVYRLHSAGESPETDSCPALHSVRRSNVCEE